MGIEPTSEAWEVLERSNFTRQPTKSHLQTFGPNFVRVPQSGDGFQKLAWPYFECSSNDI